MRIGAVTAGAANVPRVTAVGINPDGICIAMVAGRIASAPASAARGERAADASKGARGDADAERGEEEAGAVATGMPLDV